MYGSAQFVHGYSININRPTLSEMRSSQKNQEKPSTHNWINRRHGQLPLKLGFTHDYRIMSFRGFAQFLSCWNVWVGCVQPNLRAAVEYGNSTYRHSCELSSMETRPTSITTQIVQTTVYFTTLLRLCLDYFIRFWHAMRVSF